MHMHWNSDVTANGILYTSVYLVYTETNCYFSQPLSSKEDIFHVYDEILAVYSLGGPATADESSATYSNIQPPAPADNDCSPYSLVAPHW